MYLGKGDEASETRPKTPLYLLSIHVLNQLFLYIFFQDIFQRHSLVKCIYTFLFVEVIECAFRGRSVNMNLHRHRKLEGIRT